MLTRMMLLLLLLMGLVACNRDNFSAQRNPEGGVDITVTATEAEVNTLLGNALSNSDQSVIRNATIDLQAGQMVISGKIEQQNNPGSTVDADMTVTLSTVDGRLSARVTHVNVAGWSADDRRITDINQRIEEALEGRAQRDNPNVTLTSVTITDTNLTFVLNAQKSGG